MNKTSSLLFGGVSVAVIAGTALWLNAPMPSQHSGQSSPRSLQAQAVALASSGAAKVTASPAPVASVKNKANPMPELLEDYNKGDFKAVSAKAHALFAATPTVAKPTRTLVRTQHLAAFATARSRDLKTARAQFAQTQKSAALLQEKRAKPKLGEFPSATLEEDSAYQQAVCTMGLGEKAAAQTELVAFIKDYPTSPLVHAAMRRIARLNGGDIPADAEAVWKKAKEIQLTTRRAEERLASLCGPECLAELLKRRGETLSVESLAKELGTSHEGTSLATLEKIARKHGFPQAQGVQLTLAGLKAQTLPLIAVLVPGHFVLVEKLAADGSVTFWDANAEGIGKEASRTVSAQEWESLWQGGIALRLQEQEDSKKTPQSADSKRVARR